MRMHACIVVAGLVAPLVTCSSTAWAEETLGAELLALEGALVARLDAIGSPPAQGDKLEQRRLGAALRALSRHRGRNDRRDFRAIAKAGKLIARSETADDAVLVARDALVEAVARVVEHQRIVAGAIGETLLKDAFRERVSRAIERASSRLASGLERAGGDPVATQAALTRAHFAFLRSRRLGRTLSLREERRKLPPLCVIINPRSAGRVFLVNVRPGAIEIENVRYDVQVTFEGGAEGSIAFAARDLDPAAFDAGRNRVEPFTSYEITRWLLDGVDEEAVDYRGEIIVQMRRLKTLPVPYEFSVSSGVK